MLEPQNTLCPVENPRYLTDQIITYIGNKRALLQFIGTAVDEVRNNLRKEKLDVADMFSGSGIVARFFKKYSLSLHVNDLEDYCETISRSYLANREDVNFNELQRHYDEIVRTIDAQGFRKGFISEMYSPSDDGHIKQGERVFYTSRNAMYIDTARQLLDDVSEPYRTFLLAPLLHEASVHVNTSGVFKGFYKNSRTGIGQFGGNGRHALHRIMADIRLRLPIFSSFSCDVHVHKKDANALAPELPPLDFVYLDPPYNQHPYGSNYFMLNLINCYVRPSDVSRVSGIPAGWNQSAYNRKQTAFPTFENLCRSLNAKYLLISFSNDGFISKRDMLAMLADVGEVKVFDHEYNTFRGSRNLNGRNIHVREYLYLVRKYGI